jgi:hypothetical protein
LKSKLRAKEKERKAAIEQHRKVREVLRHVQQQLQHPLARDTDDDVPCNIDDVPGNTDDDNADAMSQEE